MIKEDRPKGFVASMHGVGRMSKEVVSMCVVHGATYKFVIEFFSEPASRR
jgi:hypothetical protein